MRVFLILLISLMFNFAFAKEEKLEKVKIPQEVIKQLDIKTQEIKKRTLTIIRKYPAVVKDDLTLSQAVFSPVSGLIKQLFVKEGDKVKKGQKVALIYSPEIIQLKSKLYIAKVNLENAKNVYEREKQLYENKVIPYTRYFNAMVNYENAKGKVKALENTIKAYGEIENNYIVLRAQIDGYVAKQDVILGDSVNLNKRVFKIHSHEKLWVIAFVPVKDISLFTKDKKVKIISPLGTSYGKVDFISHSVDPDTRRNQIRIIADNSKDTLKPNMFVDVLLTVKLPEKLYIPASAVVYQEDKIVAFVEEDGYFHPVDIKIGKRVGEYYQVLEGLKEGQKVVVNGTVHLKAKFFGEAEEE